jgi:hypothetical protein
MDRYSCYCGGVPADLTEKLMIGEPLRVSELREAIRNMTDREHEEIIAEMVADGILDGDGNVLVSARVPDPPDWLTGKNGHARSDAPAKPKKKVNRRKKC